MKQVTRLLVAVSGFIGLVAASQENPLDKFHSYQYGSLSADDIHHIAEHLPDGNLKIELDWLADNSRYFAFQNRENITLQGYYIPGHLYDRAHSLSNDETGTSTNKFSAGIEKLEPVVFVAGWTETTIKYAKFLHLLHNQGHDIFSFDIRGQGFSDSCTHHQVSGKKLSHVDTFQDYVDDLQQFMVEVLPQKLNEYTDNYYVDNSKYRLAPSYVGFSLSGLIGLSLAHRDPATLSADNRIVLLAPCVKPAIPHALDYILRAFRYFGYENMMAFNAILDDPTAERSHDETNMRDYHRFINLAPRQLKIAGPSVAMLHEMMVASRELLKKAPQMNVSVLILQASHDLLVDNAAMHTFVDTVGTDIQSQPTVSVVNKQQQGCGGGGVDLVIGSDERDAIKESLLPSDSADADPSATGGANDVDNQDTDDSEIAVAESASFVDAVEAVQDILNAVALETGEISPKLGSGMAAEVSADVDMAVEVDRVVPPSHITSSSNNEGACLASSDSQLQPQATSGGSGGKQPFRSKVIRYENAYHLLMNEVEEKTGKTVPPAEIMSQSPIYKALMEDQNTEVHIQNRKEADEAAAAVEASKTA